MIRIADLPVSRETRGRLETLVREVRAWQTVVNLVAPSTLSDIEHRHVADSVQLDALARVSGPWVDLGSGGGFPGLVVAAIDPGRPVTLIESDARKCAFLRHAAAAMDVTARVREGRIEREAEALAGEAVDVVSARALAPLDKLIAYAQPLLAKGAVGLFPKGRNFAEELTKARETWHFDVDILASRTDSNGRVLRISGFGGRRS